MDAKSAVEQALQSATEGEVESVTTTETETPAASETKTEPEGTQTQTPKGKEGQRVPISRLDEVAAARDEYKRKAEEFEAKYKDTDTKLAELSAKEERFNKEIQDLRSEAEILDRIRALADDPDWRPQLESLDAKLRGVEAKVESEVKSGEKTEAEGEKEIATELQKARDELQEAFEEQQTDFIVMQARSLAESYIDALPEEFTAEERTVIAEMLTPRVDWDAIADDPKDLAKHMVDGLTRTLKDYGEPRGALKAKLSDFNNNKSTEEVKTPAQLSKEIEDTDWGELVTDEDGKTSFKHGEEDFTKALANKLRIGDT